MCVECCTISREGSLSLIVEFDNLFSLIFQYGHVLFDMERVVCPLFLLAISDLLFPDQCRLSFLLLMF